MNKFILMATITLIGGISLHAYAQDLNDRNAPTRSDRMQDMELPDTDQRARGGVVVDSEITTETTIPDAREVKKMRTKDAASAAQEQKDAMDESLHINSDDRVQDLDSSPGEAGVPATANTRIDMN